MKFFSCVTTLSSSFHGLPVHDNTQGIYYLEMSSEQVKRAEGVIFYATIAGNLIKEIY